MNHAVFDLKFPGYGLMGCGEKSQPDGSVLDLSGIEIPKAGKTRYVLFRGRGGSYDLVDDFVYDDSAPIGGVVQKGNKFVYTTMDGATTIVERSPSVK